ncbi:MAG: tetratricopeptide repeat protein [Leptolyngbyaceae cyanobacterium]
MNNRLNPSRWSPIADYALLLGSGAGAIASIATQNATVATVPMTALVAMGLLNRRRIDRYLQQTDDNLAYLEGQMVSEVSILTEQVSALPTPEAINQLQRSAMEHSDRRYVQFSEAIAATESNFRQRIEAIERPDLSHIQQDTAQLQDQYTYVSATLGNLSKQIERLSHQPRMEATENDVSQLQTEVMQLRVSLESLGSESKTAQATLQDAVRHLDRRLRQAPNSADPNMLKGEVRELIKAMADLVPRRDFSALSEKTRALQASQESLQQSVDRLRSTQPNADPDDPDGIARQADLQTLQADLMIMAESLQQMEGRLEDISVPFDITSEIRGTTATYLSGLQWQLALLEQQTQDLMAQQKAGNAAPSNQPAVAALPAGAGSPTPADGSLQWLMAFRGQSQITSQTTAWSAIDQALLQALDDVSERLVLVWPWSSAVQLDEQLIERFHDILASGCRLEIGWCHPGDRHEGRLLKKITQQWHLTTAQRQLLKSTLNLLLPLKEQYPHLFSFKILGTKEQFIVCDDRYAIVGIDALPAASSIFPELDVRVKTTEISVIDQLLHRFEHPDALPEDAVAYFNRAVTRYDLRDAEGAIADFAHVLRLAPKDAIALNNRGLIWAEKKQYQRALDDFDHALSSDPRLFAAWCNRGWLYLHWGQLDAAIADFNQAIETDTTSAIPYFYRGTARQRLGDSLGASADFTTAIQKSSQMALPYCHRGAAYQRQGDISRAITDLEMAASLLHAQGNHRSLAQVTQVLSSLKKTALAQPVKLHSA